MTNNERAFISRMAPHVEAGKSFDDAARAVLAADQRLLRLWSDVDIGPEIRRALSETIYKSIRAKTARRIAAEQQIHALKDRELRRLRRKIDARS